MDMLNVLVLMLIPIRMRILVVICLELLSAGVRT